jgi:hypothetical protein
MNESKTHKEASILIKDSKNNKCLRLTNYFWDSKDLFDMQKISIR